LVTAEKGGLGLSLVHQMMVTMGGEVAYEPPESGGARFLLRLPRA
jgi:signal transduction histidine kinase